MERRDQMEFSRITIVGTGLIGGSFGLALKRKQVVTTVYGIDRPEVIQKALDIGAVDIGFDSAKLATILPQAELVILATPISQILADIPLIAKIISPGTLVTDVGSTKRQIVETADHHFPTGRWFIGGHPMTGSEKRGIDAADPFLFENATYVLTPGKSSDSPKVQKLANLLEYLGAKTVFLDPTTHDEIAAGVSHLPQFIAVALVNLIAEKNQENPYYLRLAAGGFRDITRIASSPYEIWHDICQTNAQKISQFIDRFINKLSQLKTLLETNQLNKQFDNAARNRLSIPRDTKGFLKPLFDLILAVEDKPGVIATISTTLAERNINIKDIEVLKVREGEGGTIRLALETEADRDLATALLQEKGFSCRKREE
ncbi:prephenate dehydrogenase [bacterium]|nr:prephenate dehydrogenase [bacterium]